QTSDRLVPRPAHRVHAGVDYEPAGTPHLERQPAKALIGVAIDPHVLAELFGIESPAFDVRGNVVVATELRQVCQLLAERDLEVMPRYSLVQHPGGQPVCRHLLRHPRLVADHPGDALLRAACKVAVRAALETRRHRPHAIGETWQVT